MQKEVQSELMRTVVLGAIAVTLAATGSGKCAFADESAPVPEVVISGQQYATACGPIACYAALNRVGVAVSLDETLNGCRWEEGKLTPFTNLVTYLSNKSEVEVKLVRISPPKLREFLAKPGAVAIMPVRNDSDVLNHAICVSASLDDAFLVHNYPRLEQVVSEFQLSQVWDGEALLLVSNATASQDLQIRLLIASALVLSLGLFWLYWRDPAMRIRRRETLTTPLWIWAVVFIGGVAEICSTRVMADEAAHSNKAAATLGTGKSMSASFGEVPSGKKVKHTFVFRNPTEIECLIADQRTSCHCLEVTKMPKVIAPGTVQEITVVMNLAGKYGRQDQKASFKLEHPSIKFLVLEFGGVATGRWIEPSEVNFGTIVGSKTPVLPLNLFVAGIDDCRISRVEFDEDCPLKIRREAGNRFAGKGMRGHQIRLVDSLDLKVTKIPQAAGRYRGKLRIYIDGDDKPIQATYTGVVTNAAKLTPSRLFFGAVRRGQEATRTVHAVLVDKSVVGSESSKTAWQSLFSFRSQDSALCGELNHVGKTTTADSGNAAEAAVEVFLAATFSPDATTEKGTHKGELTVLFKGRPLVTIPYVAIVLD